MKKLEDLQRELGANGFVRNPPPTLMTVRYGDWLERRAEAFAGMSSRYYKRRDARVVPKRGEK